MQVDCGSAKLITISYKPDLNAYQFHFDGGDNGRESNVVVLCDPRQTGDDYGVIFFPLFSFFIIIISDNIISDYIPRYMSTSFPVESGESRRIVSLHHHRILLQGLQSGLSDEP